MKYLKEHWQSRTFILLLISIVLAVLMISLELTDWAQHINQVGYSHGGEEGGKRNIPQIMRYILPFVKELILIGVPLALTLLWLNLPIR